MIRIPTHIHATTVRERPGHMPHRAQATTRMGILDAADGLHVAGVEEVFPCCGKQAGLCGGGEEVGEGEGGKDGVVDE